MPAPPCAGSETMIYTFACSGPECDGVVDVTRSIKEGPPDSFLCPVCESWAMERVWHPPQFICSGDPDEIPETMKVADLGGGGRVTHRQMMGLGKAGAQRKNRAYQDYIDDRRRLFREEKQEGGRMTHQVPAELYHGKIKQTGDKDYWRDPSNLNKHKSCKVS